MKLSKEEMHYLQKLSRLKIDNEEEFLIKLKSVISYLEDFANTDTIQNKKSLHHTHSLETIDITTPPGEKGILQNVEHEILNNSIVIKTKLG